MTRVPLCAARDPPLQRKPAFMITLKCRCHFLFSRRFVPAAPTSFNHSDPPVVHLDPDLVCVGTDSVFVLEASVSYDHSVCVCVCVSVCRGLGGWSLHTSLNDGGASGTNMLTVTKHAEKEELVMSFTKELLLLQIHTVEGNDFPGPSTMLLDGQNLWALKQKEL